MVVVQVGENRREGYVEDSRNKIYMAKGGGDLPRDASCRDKIR